MASACVNSVSIPPDPFPPPYTWSEITDPDLSPPEFEFFTLQHPQTTAAAAADELFSHGKLVPLHLRSTTTPPPPDIKSPPTTTTTTTDGMITSCFSPRAPTCSIRWRNILRLKKLHLLTKPKSSTTPSPLLISSNHHDHSHDHGHGGGMPNPSRSLTSILNRVGSRLPPPKDSDTESVSTSSRLSLSSSSSSSSSSHEDVVPKQRRAGSGSGSGVLVDSPRLNSSGKVVFERSSSSPGSFSGGPRYKHGGGGMERSYSAHVRVAPVLNVPVVCSIRGSNKFGFPLFGPHKRGEAGGSNRIQFQRRNSKNGSRTGGGVEA